MKKPKRKNYWDITIETNDGKIYGGGDIYNAGYDAIEKYYKWYIKTHCVRKEDLPDEEGWFEICYAVVETSEFCENWDDFTEQKALDLAKSLAKQIVKRIGKER